MWPEKYEPPKFLHKPCLNQLVYIFSHEKSVLFFVDLVRLIAVYGMWPEMANFFSHFCLDNHMGKVHPKWFLPTPPRKKVIWMRKNTGTDRNCLSFGSPW